MKKIKKNIIVLQIKHNILKQIEEKCDGTRCCTLKPFKIENKEITQEQINYHLNILLDDGCIISNKSSHTKLPIKILGLTVQGRRELEVMNNKSKLVINEFWKNRINIATDFLKLLYYIIQIINII